MPPGIIGVIAWMALRLAEGRTSGLIGLVGAVIAAPALLVVGAPFADDTRYPLAVIASGVMWMVIGLIAARRATRSPMATWSDYWRQYTSFFTGISLGAIGALIVATIVLGESLV